MMRPRKMRLGMKRPPTIRPGSFEIFFDRSIALIPNAERQMPFESGHASQCGDDFLQTAEPKSMRAACQSFALSPVPSPQGGGVAEGRGEGPSKATRNIFSAIGS